MRAIDFMGTGEPNQSRHNTKGFNTGMRRLILSSAIGLVATFAWPAWAYRTVSHEGVAATGWTEREIVLEVVGSIPGTVSLDEAFSELLAGANVWIAPGTCDVPKISVVRGFGPGGATNDGINTIEWVYSDWASTGAAPDASGVTSVVLAKTDDDGYRIVEADVLLNAERFTWAVMSKAASPQMSVAAVAAHEFGHVLGLEHPCELEPTVDVPYCPAGDYNASLMYPLSSAATPSLFADDIAGACSLYDTACSGSACADPGDPGPRLAAEGEACESTSSCAEPLQCIGGLCMSRNAGLGDYCRRDDDCSAGACSDEACHATCAEDEDCGIGVQTCDLETNVCGRVLSANGELCRTAEECISGLCFVPTEQAAYCTRTCSDDVPCPKGETCSLDSGKRICTRDVPRADGCTVQRPIQNENWWGTTFLLLTLGTGVRRYNKRTQSLVKKS